MAASDYAVVSGTVQQFKDKPVVTEREVSNQTVRDFTIKSTGNQKLVRVTLFPEWEDVEIVKGASVMVEGRATTNERNGTTYYNITASSSLVVTPPARRKEREVVNKSGAGEDPFA